MLVNDEPFETQKFNQKWLTILLAVTLVITVIISIRGFSGENINYVPLILPPLVCISVIVLLRSMTLTTKIDTDAIAFRFTPFQLSDRRIEKDSVESVAVTRYNPLAEYGGWGIRIGFKGRAYTTSGVYGISIRLKNGKHILIGTNKPQEAQLMLEKFWPDKGHSR